MTSVKDPLVSLGFFCISSTLTNLTLFMKELQITTDAKLGYLGLLQLKEKLMVNKTVLVFKACRNLAPPYLKQLVICSSICTTSRFITAQT